MKKKYFGVIGATGKIGSILAGRADFVKLDCDVRAFSSLHGLRMYLDGNYNGLDVIVNCAAISSIDDCEKDYKKAIEVNVHGLSNLHKVFGERVLNISTDHIFSGRSWFLPKEDTVPNPTNAYGLTKVAAEGVSQVFEGKTLRLSRTISLDDPDIAQYMAEIGLKKPVEVPGFFSRNYIHRDLAADGIEYFVRNWDSMPQVVNYAGTENVTMYSLMRMIALEFGLDANLIKKKSKYDDTLVPRPRKGGLNVSLAQSLGFPMYNVSESIARL